MRKYSTRERFSLDLQLLLRFCHGEFYGITIGEAYRTKEQQALHRKAGRSKVKVSQHQKRLAIDLHIWDNKEGSKYISDDQWLVIGRYWLSLSPKNRWGGRFGVKKKDYATEIGWDRYHFERRS